MPSTASVIPTGDVYINGILGGTKWGVNSLTFSFPTDPTFYGSPYAAGETVTGFEAFTAQQQAAVRSILTMYSSVINFTFTEVTETATQHGDLRYAESDLPSTAWAYYPSMSQLGGDAWFNNSKGWYDFPALGNYARLTMMHETGHAMGLKHPHTASGSFGVEPADHDSLEYTIMSYRSYIGAGTNGLTNETYGYPQTLMMLDIAALQEMYGANFTSNSGDTVYRWDPLTGREFVNGVGQATPGANRIFMTVWDGGGNDTYDFSNYTTNLNVNLSPGGWTVTSSAQLAFLGAGHYAIGNIANALLYHGNTASLIDDAIGGAGNDIITGNIAANHLTGGIGNDALDGGVGVDTAVYSGLMVNYQFVHNTDGSWTITDLRGGNPDGTDTLTNIELIQFGDQLVSIDLLGGTPVLQVPMIASFSNDSGTTGDGITNDKILTLSGAATGGSTVKVFDGATLLGSVTADATGAWSFTTALLNEGSHSFTATASDAGGNATSSSPAFTVTVDSIAPNTPAITSFSPDSSVVGDGITNASTLTLHGNAEAGSVVHVYDGTTLLGTTTVDATGSWSYSTFDPSNAPFAFSCGCAACIAARESEENGQDNYVGQNGSQLDSAGSGSVLADGGHSFTVVAVDTAGNTSAASMALNVTVDTVAPNAPAIVSYSNDSGVVGDGITNDNTLTLTGTAAVNSTVKIFDGATQIGTATADATGAWTLATATLTNGAHSFSATATDAAGNTSAASMALNVTVDTVAPNAPAIVSYSNDSGVVGDGITNDNTLTLTGTAAVNSTVKIFDGATQIGTAVANASGAWNYTTATLTDGAHSFSATATDAAGNTSSMSTALNVTVAVASSSVPTITSYSPDSAVVGDGFTNANHVTLTGMAVAYSNVQVFDGTKFLGTVAASGAGVWSYATAPLSDGAHSFTVKATDAAGNTSAASTALTVTVDTNAPSSPAVASFLNDTGAVGDGVTKENLLVLTGGAEAGSTVQIYDGAVLLGTTIANSSGGWSFATAMLADGAHAFTANATDAAGNISATSSAMAVTVDTVAPVAATLASYSNDSGSTGDGVTYDNTLVLMGTAEANSTVNIFDRGTWLGSATANAAGTWTFTTSQLADGAHTFTAIATDQADNVGATSAALNVTVDTVAPNAPVSIAYTPNYPSGSASASSSQTSNGTVDTGYLTLAGVAEANSTVRVYDGTTLLGTVSASSAGVWQFHTAELADGVHDFTAKATDAAGNVGVASAAVVVTVNTVAPNTPTIVSFSPDVGVVGDGITSAQVVTLAGTADANIVVKVYEGITLLGQAIANAAGDWSFTTATLSNGAHTFAANAVDAAGHVSANSAALTVTVDLNAPANHAPTVLANVTPVARGQSVAASSLFSVSDVDHDAITQYQFRDDTSAATSGHFVVNGIDHGALTSITVTAAQLSQTSFQSGVGSDIIYARAFDGQTWSGWTQLPVDVANHASKVTANSIAVTRGQEVAVSSLFSVSDADNDAVTRYQFRDATASGASGYFVLNGVAQAAQSTIDLSPSQLNQLTFQSGVGSDSIYVRAYDGYGWSGWTQLHVDVANHASVVTANATMLARGQSVAASSLFSVNDADNDGVTRYQFWDGTANGASGYFVLNGVVQATQSTIDLSPAQLNQLTFQSGVGSDSIHVRAYDGYGWSDWTQLHVEVANSAAIVAAHVTSAAREQTVAVSSLFSVSDADSDTITAYQFWDNSTDAASGHFLVNGVAQAALITIDVSAAGLSQTSFLSGASTESLYMRAFDGYNWSDWTALHVDVSNHAPVITATSTAVNSGQSITASSLFSISDSDNDTIAQYQLWDHSASSASGHFVVNGVAQAAQTVIDVSAADLAQASYQGGLVSDELYMRAYDGLEWSDWTRIDVTANSSSGATPSSSTDIVGTVGNDLLVSGSSNETLTGGGGIDTLVFVPNFGKDIVTDFKATGADHDVLEFSQATFSDFASVLAHATQVGFDVVIAADPHNSVTLKSINMADLQSNNIHII